MDCDERAQLLDEAITLNWCAMANMEIDRHQAEHALDMQRGLLRRLRSAQLVGAGQNAAADASRD